MGMRYGITCNKGRVNICLGKPISGELLNLPKAPNKNVQYDEAARFIDTKIYQGYVHYPINYVSADILSGTSQYANHYTEADRKAVIEYFDTQCKMFEGDVALQRKMLMEIYANPVINYYNNIATK